MNFGISHLEKIEFWYKPTILLIKGNTIIFRRMRPNLVVYKNMFQENQIFAREEVELTEELEEDKQRKFRQKYRVEKLTPEEIKTISTEEFIKAKKEYIESLEEVK